MSLNNNFKLLPAILLIFIVIAACTKDNELPAEDSILGRTVRYTVLVVPGGGTSFKSAMGIDSAIVSLVMNDSVYSKATDANGLVSFNNLAAGIAAVTVKYNNYTTANLIVDLTIKNDSGYDSENIRNASTMVALFPLSGNGTATISGKAIAQLDSTNIGIENAPAGLLIGTSIESAQLKDYVNHTGDGEILSIAYENSTNHSPTDANSDYSIVVPATGSGLKIIITSDAFEYDQITTGGTHRKVFKAIADTITAISGVNYYNDIQFN